MTREEEREIAAKESTKGDDFQDACIGKAYFIIGAEWADKTMIEKACKWLNSFLSCHYVMRYHDSCEPVHEYIVEGFKRAMEE